MKGRSECALRSHLQLQSPLILDGGLATELERRGADLDHSLWSARLLADRPELIGEAHLAFLEAGADIIISASYQASIAGFVDLGMSRDRAVRLIQSSVDIAIQARDEFCASPAAKGRIRPLVAASVGPYGACKADGSEYHGRYGVPRRRLIDFHKARMEILADTEADLLALETIPSLFEAEVLLELLDQVKDRCAWLSFSCSDDRHISHGERFSEGAAMADAHPGIAAVGVNCTKPSLVANLLESAGNIAVPLLAYPNSGEEWDSDARCWTGQGDNLSMARRWVEAGAEIVGGCCRVGPAAISGLRKSLLG